MLDNLKDSNCSTQISTRVDYEAPKIVVLDTKSTILGGEDLILESEGGQFGS